MDKGDRVVAGQVLAVIDSPELDRQYDAAVADAKIKRADAERAWVLLGQDSIARQATEDAEAAAKVSEANAAALKAQKGYLIITAPFSGTVTARFADPGALVQEATTNQTAALPLVNLSRTDRLRIYIYVDQKNAGFVHPGESVEVWNAARPEIKLPALVSRISGQLDLNTRTLLTELDLDNRQGEIISGSFIQVSLTLRTPPLVEVPVEALRMSGEKAQVGVILTGNRVVFRPVVISESDGKMIKVYSGLKEGEQVVLNPGLDLSDGERVRIVPLTP